MAADCVLVLLVVWRLLDRLRYYLTALALSVREAVPPPLQGLPARLSDGTFSRHERKYIGSTGPSSFGACPLIPDSDRIPGIVRGPVRGRPPAPQTGPLFAVARRGQGRVQGSVSRMEGRRAGKAPLTPGCLR
jgi:hypothetical protein